MTLLVRDNEDIVAANIEYHLSRGVDFIIATDNRSVDGTPAILETYRARGLVHVISEQEDSYAQQQWVTRMARLAHSQFGADWVINNDVDEFWWPEDATTLKQALERVPRRATTVAAPRFNFIPRASTSGRNFTETMTLRETASFNALGDPLPGKVCHRGSPDVEVQMGNHAVSMGGRRARPVKAPLSVLHFPLRTYREFENKIALGGAALARNNQLAASAGATWRRLHEMLDRGELQSYYNAQELDEATVGRGLASGQLVRDYRLRDYIRSHVKATDLRQA
jgi:hypothetical protein